MWLQGYEEDILRWMIPSPYQPLLEKLQANQDRILPRFKGTESYDLVESIFGCVRVCLEGCENYRKNLPPAAPKVFERDEIKDAIREAEEASESFYNHKLYKPGDPALAFFDEIKIALQERLAELRALNVRPQTRNGPFI